MIKFLHLLYCILISILFSGCAVSTINGHVSYGLDGAEVFGKVEQTFLLADGSKGSVRSLNGEQSIKLENSNRVVNVPNSKYLKVRSTALIDGEHVLVIDAIENYCRKRTWLFVVAAKETKVWNFGDCQSFSNTSLGGGTILITELMAGVTKSYTYVQGKVYNGVQHHVPLKGLPDAPGSLEPIPDSYPLTRYRPSAPVRISVAKKLPPQDIEEEVALTINKPQRKLAAPAPPALPSAKQIGLHGDSVQPAFTVRLSD